MRDRLLHFLARCVWRIPIVIVVLSVAAAAVGGLCAHWFLQINANTNDLISPDRPFMKDFHAFLKEFGDTEYLYAVVANNGNRQRTEACVDALTEELKHAGSHPNAFSGVTPPEQLRIASRAMSDNELAGLSLASGAFPFLVSATAGEVVQQSSTLLDKLISEGSRMSEQQQQRVGAAAVFMVNVIASAREGSPSANELAFLLGRDRHVEYFKSTSGNLYFITIIPQKDYSTLNVIEQPLRQIRAAIATVQRQFSDVEIGLTGKPVLQADEMATTDDDMRHSAVAAFILCSALMMLMFRSVWRPVLSAIAFACAAGWTYGFATVTAGQLNLLSIVFILVLVGVGLDYGVHIISRYREHRTRGDVQSSIAGAILTAGRGNITGSIASAIVFFMAFFTSFQGLRQLGLIAGSGLLLCAAAMTIVLPALLALLNRWRAGANTAEGLEAEHPEDVRAGVLGVIVAHPWIVLTAVAVITLGLSFAPARLRFEQNLLKLQATGLDAVKWEHRIADDSASNTWFGVAIADTLDEAHDFTVRAQTRPTIGEVHSVLDIIKPPTSQQEQNRRLLHESLPANLLASTATQPETSAGKSKVAEWGVDDLKGMNEKLNLIALGAASKAPEEAKRLRQIATDIKALAGQPDARTRIERNIASVGESLGMILDGDKLSLRVALPDGLRRQFMSPQGRFAVMLHPRENVWEYEPMKAFVSDMRAVDPDVTGVPITQLESLGDMRHAFGLMSILAVLVLVGIVALDFRSPRFILLALLPMVLGAVWTAEFMGLFDISFNLANFFSVPILIGLSVNGSVYVLHRYREGGPTRFSLGATRRAVILTAINTFIGFGSLMFAHHRGLRSLGQVMAIGTIACLIASVVVLPALLAWLEKRQMVNAGRRHEYENAAMARGSPSIRQRSSVDREIVESPRR